MVEFYLALEKTGWNPHEDRIMAISFHELEKETGNPVGELKILEEWTSSEPTIIGEFLQILNLENSWNFVPIGFDLRSDFRFLRIRALKTLGISLRWEFLYETLPAIDLLPIAILMNKGRFKGTNLAWVLGHTEPKRTETTLVNQWFQAQDYERVISYIHAKKDRFLDFYRYLRQKMPLVWAQHTPLASNVL
ncbi:MAG: hypothetical protein ACXAB4_00040 [Candidatus Hodarchaeales archaeon]